MILKVALFCCAGLLTLPVIGEDSHDLINQRPSADSASDLEKQHQEIGEQIEALVQKAHNKNVEINQFNRKSIYGDDKKARVIRELHAEVKRLEKQVHEKRKALSDAISQVPEAKKLEDERRQIFKEIARLKNEQRAVDNELQRARSMQKENK